MNKIKTIKKTYLLFIVILCFADKFIAQYRLLDNFTITSFDFKSKPVNINYPYSVSLSLKNKRLIKSFNHTERNFYLKNFIVPTTLITYGSVSKVFSPFENIDKNIHKNVLLNIERKYKIDNYIQFIPVFSVFALDIFNVTPKHSILERVFLTGTSISFAGIIVASLKTTSNILRPDDSSYNSFPSGHTTIAFLGSHLLYKEYKNNYKWIGISGYIIGTTTGFLRVINNRHWFSDVVFGAGAGIISAEFSYLLLRSFQKVVDNKKVKRHKI